MTLQERIAQLVLQHGTLRAAALVLDIDVGYLSRLSNGTKSKPGPRILRKLRLKAITSYEKI